VGRRLWRRLSISRGCRPREIKQYTLSDHIRPHWKKAKELFEEFSQRVLGLDPRFEIHPVKYYIGFNIENSNVIIVKIRSSKLLLELLRVEPEELKDPEKERDIKRKVLSITTKQ